MKDEGNPRNLTEWLGMTTKPDFSAAKRFGRVVGATLTIVGVIMFAAMLTLVLGVAFATFDVVFSVSGVNSEDIRNIGLVLAALIGAPFLVWRTIVAAKQVAISDEALFNDKINAAAQDLAARREVTRVVKQDGKDVILSEMEDDLVTRAAAIDRLEALTHERPDMAPRIDRLLATYVRGTFPHEGLEETKPPFDRKSPRMDLQRAIDAIGRIHELAVEVDPSYWRLDLKGCDFDGVSFQGGHFWAADFSNCRFEGANLSDGNFKGALLNGSMMNFAIFFDVDFTGAKLDWVKIRKTSGAPGSFMTEKLNGLSLIGADLSGLRRIARKDILEFTFGCSDTVLSQTAAAKVIRTEDWQWAFDALEQLDAGGEVTEEDRKLAASLKASGFRHWSPYTSDDLASHGIRKELYKKLDLMRWPYWES